MRAWPMRSRLWWSAARLEVRDESEGEEAYESRSFDCIGVRVRTCGLPGLPGHQPRSAAAAYAADVGDQRDIWHLADWVAGACRGRALPAVCAHSRLCRGDSGDDQRGGWIRHYRSHAED